MKKLIIFTICTLVTACSAHLPTTEINQLDEVRTAIKNARDAGAEQCAPALLAKAEARQLYAAHELEEDSSYNSQEAEDLIDEALSLAKKSKAKCAHSNLIIKAAVSPVPVAVPVSKAIKAEKIILDGVFFESNSANLTAASTSTLNQAVETLRKRPDIHVEVGAHTDSGGKASYNDYLSSLRASEVKAYLVKHGIAATRLSAKGYGESTPIADNKTKAGKAKNRRVELKIK
ncbi:MAG: OmpA family protein [Ghiorsea sp.]